MLAKLKNRWWIAVSILVVILFCSVFFREQPVCRAEEHPDIITISLAFGKDGEAYNYDLSKSDIPDDLNDALISLFLNAKMRNSLLPPPTNYTITDNSVYITIKVSLDHPKRSNIRINLCTVREYNCAQSGDTYYHISNYKELYQDVYKLISDAIPMYAVET